MALAATSQNRADGHGCIPCDHSAGTLGAGSATSQLTKACTPSISPSRSAQRPRPEPGDVASGLWKQREKDQGRE